MYEYHVEVAPLDPVESRLVLNKMSRKGWRVAAVLYTNHLVLEREAREEVEVKPETVEKQQVLPPPEEVKPPEDFGFEPDEAVEAELQDR